jgi:hypothetical protein
LGTPKPKEAPKATKAFKISRYKIATENIKILAALVSDKNVINCDIFKTCFSRSHLEKSGISES